MPTVWNDMSDPGARLQELTGILDGQLQKGQRKYHDRLTEFQGKPLDHLLEEAADTLIYLHIERARQRERDILLNNILGKLYTTIQTPSRRQIMDALYHGAEYTLEITEPTGFRYPEMVKVVTSPLFREHSEEENADASLVILEGPQVVMEPLPLDTEVTGNIIWKLNTASPLMPEHPPVREAFTGTVTDVGSEFLTPHLTRVTITAPGV